MIGKKAVLWHLPIIGITIDLNGTCQAIHHDSDQPFLITCNPLCVYQGRKPTRSPHCKEAYQPTPDDIPKDFPWDRAGEFTWYRPVGCRECRNLGYSGRMGIYELLVSNDDIRQLAQDRASSWDIRKAAVATGMRTLRMDAWDKVIAGYTSIDEVLRVTKGEAL